METTNDKHELAGLDPISWGVQKYYLTRTDEQLATGLCTTVEEIIRVREDLGLIREEGTQTMKEFAQEMFKKMTPLEKKAYILNLEEKKPGFMLEMAEGKAPTTGELTINNEPVKIDITHHLLKTYAPITGSGESVIDVPFSSKESRLSAGSSK